MNRKLKDTRRHPRFTVDVEVTVFPAGGGKPLKARTRDLSRSGICLITSDSLHGAVPLVVEMVLSFGDNAFSEPLRLEAHVVWCTPIGKAFQVGAMFDDLSEEQDGFLDMFLRFLDGSLAPRGVQPSEEEEEEPPPHPDVKDDPFRS
jgi:hypothetical protein